MSRILRNLLVLLLLLNFANVFAGKKWVQCYGCGGTGYIESWHHVVRTCPACGGTGGEYVDQKEYDSFIDALYEACTYRYKKIEPNDVITEELISYEDYQSLPKNKLKYLSKGMSRKTWEEAVSKVTGYRYSDLIKGAKFKNFKRESFTTYQYFSICLIEPKDVVTDELTSYSAYSKKTINSLRFLSEGLSWSAWSKGVWYVTGCEPDDLTVGTKYVSAEHQKEIKRKVREKERIAEEKRLERQRIAEEKERERQRIAEEKYENELLLKANSGNVSAQYELSDFYYDKRDDENQSVYWLEKAATQDYGDSRKKLADWYYGKGKWTFALKWLEYSAVDGDVESQYRMGVCYMKLDNYRDAVTWLEKSKGKGKNVQSDLVYCYLSLGKECYNQGNVNEAEVWFKKTLDLSPGNETAKRGLADIYFGKKDYDKAEKYYSQLPQSSDVRDKLHVIYSYRINKSNDKKEKIELLRKDYEVSKLECSRYSLVKLCLEYGDECKEAKNYKEAFDSYKLAYDMKSAEAAPKLAYMYKKGLGVTKDKDYADVLLGKTPKKSKKKETTTDKYGVPMAKAVRERADVKGSGFMLFEVGFSNAPQSSFGFSIGGVKKIGGYAKMRFRSLAHNSTMSVYKALSQYPDTDDWEKRNKLFSVTGGLLFRLGCPLHLNVGLGYGKRVQMYELDSETVSEYDEKSGTTSTWEKHTCVVGEDSEVKGMAMDLGLLLYLKRFSLRAGVSTIGFKYTDVEVGIGFNFGKN